MKNSSNYQSNYKKTTNYNKNYNNPDYSSNYNVTNRLTSPSTGHLAPPPPPPPSRVNTPSFGYPPLFKGHLGSINNNKLINEIYEIKLDEICIVDSIHIVPDGITPPSMNITGRTKPIITERPFKLTMYVRDVKTNKIIPINEWTINGGVQCIPLPNEIKLLSVDYIAFGGDFDIITVIIHGKKIKTNDLITNNPLPLPDVNINSQVNYKIDYDGDSDDDYEDNQYLNKQTNLSILLTIKSNHVNNKLKKSIHQSYYNNDLVAQFYLQHDINCSLDYNKVSIQSIGDLIEKIYLYDNNITYSFTDIDKYIVNFNDIADKLSQCWESSKVPINNKSENYDNISMLGDEAVIALTTKITKALTTILQDNISILQIADFENYEEYSRKFLQWSHSLLLCCENLLVNNYTAKAFAEAGGITLLGIIAGQTSLLPVSVLNKVVRCLNKACNHTNLHVLLFEPANINSNEYSNVSVYQTILLVLGNFKSYNKDTALTNECTKFINSSNIYNALIELKDLSFELSTNILNKVCDVTLWRAAITNNNIQSTDLFNILTNLSVDTIDIELDSQMNGEISKQINGNLNISNHLSKESIDLTKSLNYQVSLCSALLLKARYLLKYVTNYISTSNELYTHLIELLTSNNFLASIVSLVAFYLSIHELISLLNNQQLQVNQQLSHLKDDLIKQILFIFRLLFQMRHHEILFCQSLDSIKLLYELIGSKVDIHICQSIEEFSDSIPNNSLDITIVTVSIIPYITVRSFDKINLLSNCISSYLKSFQSNVNPSNNHELIKVLVELNEFVNITIYKPIVTQLICYHVLDSLVNLLYHLNDLADSLTDDEIVVFIYTKQLLIFCITSTNKIVINKVSNHFQKSLLFEIIDNQIMKNLLDKYNLKQSRSKLVSYLSNNQSIQILSDIQILPIVLSSYKLTSIEFISDLLNQISNYLLISLVNKLTIALNIQLSNNAESIISYVSTNKLFHNQINSYIIKLCKGVNYLSITLGLLGSPTISIDNYMDSSSINEESSSVDNHIENSDVKLKDSKLFNNADRLSTNSDAIKVVNDTITDKSTGLTSISDNSISLSYLLESLLASTMILFQTISKYSQTIDNTTVKTLLSIANICVSTIGIDRSTKLGQLCRRLYNVVTKLFTIHFNNNEKALAIYLVEVLDHPKFIYSFLYVLNELLNHSIESHKDNAIDKSTQYKELIQSSNFSNKLNNYNVDVNSSTDIKVNIDYLSIINWQSLLVNASKKIEVSNSLLEKLPSYKQFSYFMIYISTLLKSSSVHIYNQLTAFVSNVLLLGNSDLSDLLITYIYNYISGKLTLLDNNNNTDDSPVKDINKCIILLDQLVTINSTVSLLILLDKGIIHQIYKTIQLSINKNVDESIILLIIQLLTSIYRSISVLITNYPSNHVNESVYKPLKVLYHYINTSSIYLLSNYLIKHIEICDARIIAQIIVYLSILPGDFIHLFIQLVNQTISSIEVIAVKIWIALEEVFQQLNEIIEIKRNLLSLQKYNYTSTNRLSNLPNNYEALLLNIDSYFSVIHNNFTYITYSLKLILEITYNSYIYDMISLSTFSKVVRSTLIDPRKLVSRIQRSYIMWFTDFSSYKYLINYNKTYKVDGKIDIKSDISLQHGVLVNSLCMMRSTYLSYGLSYLTIDEKSNNFESKHLTITNSFKVIVEISSKAAKYIFNKEDKIIENSFDYKVDSKLDKQNVINICANNKFWLIFQKPFYYLSNRMITNCLSNYLENQLNGKTVNDEDTNWFNKIGSKYLPNQPSNYNFIHLSIRSHLIDGKESIYNQNSKLSIKLIQSSYSLNKYKNVYNDELNSYIVKKRKELLNINDSVIPPDISNYPLAPSLSLSGIDSSVYNYSNVYSNDINKESFNSVYNNEYQYQPVVNDFVIPNSEKSNIESFNYPQYQSNYPINDQAYYQSYQDPNYIPNEHLNYQSLNENNNYPTNNFLYQPKQVNFNEYGNTDVNKYDQTITSNPNQSYFDNAPPKRRKTRFN